MLVAAEAGGSVQPQQLVEILRRPRVSIYHGWRQQDDNLGRRRVMGRNTFEAHFNHYTVDAANQWTIEDDLLVRW